MPLLKDCHFTISMHVFYCSNICLTKTSAKAIISSESLKSKWY